MNWDQLGQGAEEGVALVGPAAASAWASISQRRPSGWRSPGFLEESTSTKVGSGAHINHFCLVFPVLASFVFPHRAQLSLLFAAPNGCSVPLKLAALPAFAMPAARGIPCLAAITPALPRTIDDLPLELADVVVTELTSPTETLCTYP